MFLVGLTGGIACGKSTASAIFEERGIQVVDSDAIAREVVQPGEHAYTKLRAEFGDEFFDDENGGVLRREKLGKVVFADSDKRRRLNAITHPEIRKRILLRLLRHFVNGERFVVMDVPLFFEVGYHRFIKKVVVMDCDEQTQLARLMARDGMSEEDAKARIRSQMPMEEKRKLATYLIDNDGSREDTAKQIHEVIDQLEASLLPFVVRDQKVSEFRFYTVSTDKASNDPCEDEYIKPPVTLVPIQFLRMIVKSLSLFALLVASAMADSCLHCICLHESGCKPIGCHMDVGSLSCGYYQIKMPYYEDCGQPGKRAGESTETAWKRCADDYSCATQCVQNYINRYSRFCEGVGSCQRMSRLHNGGPSGCKYSSTEGYWNAIHSCCGCS
ncbi:hypothetical protein QR680_003529 [Steinernema hermaphroditum]|uniref:Dephospho-CoA kinase domain-containing protein n=1 Tax=Steinernema hermaphroditum TaxID=289476 RepID=A0AA39HLQ4_9BILA|nr:hypothetical protein QR680_003529 [Steinernema hermaphroditum]